MRLQAFLFASSVWMVLFMLPRMQNVCSRLQSTHPDADVICQDTYAHMDSRPLDGGYTEFKCQGGLTEISIPIIIEEEHLADAYIGQFAYEDDVIDRDYFIRQAHELGFKLSDYISALDDIPRFSHDKILHILNYYKEFIQALAESGIVRIESIRAKEKAENVAKRINSLFHSMDDLIFVNNKNRKYTEFISSNTQYLFKPVDEIIGHHISDVMPTEVSSVYLDAFDRLDEGSEHEEIEYSLAIDGKSYWFSAKATKVKDPDGDDYEYITVIRNISDLKKNENMIKQMAYYDNLTGLYNRSMFYESLNTAIKKSTREDSQFAVVFVDLDNFKKINDTRGHHIGDVLLKQVGTRLSAAIRDSDIIARMGGDEFTMIITSYDTVTELPSLTKRLLDVLSQPVTIEDTYIFISGSIGVSVFPADGSSSDELVKNADAAMYKAKELGRNRYQFYNQHINDEIRKKFELENKLRDAVQEKEFDLNYQPIIEVGTNKIRGFEALLRWSPDKGSSIAPLDFIPVAEETGLLLPIGYWILRKACHFNHNVHTKFGLNTIVSVNISIVQLNDADFVDMLTEILEETGLRPEFLELEITEDLLVRNFDATKEKLMAIKALGIRIALDDFGIGYSSLSYVKNLPLDSLKIDRRFIRDICNNEHDKIILEVILTLAHKLNLQVISEGVETLDQVLLLESSESDYIQGYYYYKPMTHTKLLSVLENELDS